MSETIGTAYVQVEPSFDGVVPTIDKHFGGAGESGGKSFSKGFGSVVGTIGKVAAGAVAAGTAAIGGLTKQAVSAYADFEQLEGGAKLLFGSAFTTVMDNASTAFSRVQMSANDYLAQANGYATGLKESLGGDEQAAANLADRIMVAQADIVAATGESQESIQNAFNGIMKNNFMMLDNLRLGIKPTKEGMQEVIDKMNEWNAAQGNATNYQMDNLADMESAIVDYVKYVGMAGYANDEASTTIQGSLASMKAAWENLLAGLGQGDMSVISENIDNLVETIGGFSGNIIPVIGNALQGISTLIAQLAPQLGQMLSGLLPQVLPDLLNASVSIIQALGEGLLTALPEMVPQITELVLSIADTLISMAPQLVDVAIQLIESLGNGLAESLPTLIPKIVEVVVTICESLLENAPMLIEVAIQLILALAEGLLNAMPVLIEKMPAILEALINALLQGLPLLIQGAIQLMTGIAQHAPEIISALVDVLPQMITLIVDALPQYIPMLITGAIQLVTALAAAWPQIIAALISVIPQAVESISQAFSQLGPALMATLTNAMAQAAPAFDQLKVVAQQSWEAIKAAFSSTGEYFKTKFLTAVNNMKSAFSSVKAFFQNIWNQIKQVFADVGSKFKEVGSQIVNGIKSGLEGSWENLKAFLSRACGDLIALAKKILGISSPSREFARQVGQWIPAGIAQGIKNGMGVLNSEIKSMTDDMFVGTISASTEAVNSISLVQDAGLDRVGGSVVINNNIRVDGAQDPEAWTQTFISTLKREARMA